MKIIVGSDHAALDLRPKVVEYLISKGHEVVDSGTHRDRANYAVEGFKVAENVAIGNNDLGIVICGTGIGISIAANKVKGIRAAACQDFFAAKYTRLHNDANVLCLGERITGHGTALEICEVFLNTDFEQGGRHKTRVDLITELEK